MPRTTDARGHLASLAELVVRLGEGDDPTGLAAVAGAVGADAALVYHHRSQDEPGERAANGATAAPQDVPAVVQDLGATAQDGRPRWLADLPGDLAAPHTPPGWEGMASGCSLPLRARGVLVGALGLCWAEHHDFDDAEQQMLLTAAALAAGALTYGVPAGSTRPAPGQGGSPWQRYEYPEIPGLSLAWSVPGPRARCAVGRPAPASGLRDGSLFVSLLDGEPGADGSPLEAVAGVLALARRNGTPPGLVGQAVAQVAEDLPGTVSGAHVEACPEGGWIAVAPLDHDVVIASQGAGTGRATPPSAGRPAGERLVVAGERGAAVLALALAPRTDAAVARSVRSAVERVVSGEGRWNARGLLAATESSLHADHLQASVHGLLALVADPWQPDEHEARRVRRLPANASSVALARRFAVGALPEGADESTTRAVELAASELASNAVRHAHDEVVVTLVDEASGTWLGVTDDDDREPRRPSVATSGDAESGRGLGLLDALVDEIGTTPRPSGGKTVWVRLRWRRDPDGGDTDGGDTDGGDTDGGDTDGGDTASREGGAGG